MSLHCEARMFRAIDLFGGCGGMSAGFRSAGATILAGADSNLKYLSSFRENFPDALGLQQDLRSFTPDRMGDMIGIRKGALDVVFGGPPCQGFSKNVPRKNRSLDDENNLLVKVFLSYCERLKPRFILMENVAEMKNGFAEAYTDEVLERLNSSGYEVCHSVLNA